MNKPIRNILILLFPIFFIIITNESIRYYRDVKYHSHRKQTTINSNEKSINSCSWECHNSTIYCKNNHVKINKWMLKITDIPYYTTIDLLKKSKRDYESDNLIYLVFGIPLLVYFMLIKCIDNYNQIKSLKKPI